MLNISISKSQLGNAGCAAARQNRHTVCHPLPSAFMNAELALDHLAPTQVGSDNISVSFKACVKLVRASIYRYKASLDLIAIMAISHQMVRHLLLEWITQRDAPKLI